MTVSTLTGITGLCRCAVCKIDLRGRFVFIDAQTEELFGYASEELFGKSIQDYLDNESSAIIDQALGERNHYETHYDHAVLTVIDKTGARKQVDATISLCFAAGNPVNYQLILRPGSAAVASTASQPPVGMSVESFVERTVTMEPANRFRALAELLCEYTSAEQVAIYLTGNDRLEPLACSAERDSDRISFDAVSDPTELHLLVARSGQEYDWTGFTKGQTDGLNRPPEFVACASIDGRDCLVRFIFDGNLASDLRAGLVERSRLALRIVGHIFGPESSGDAADPGIDMKFTIGFLSALGFGALLTDADGCIIGYNPALLELLEGKPPGETSREFVGLLEGGNSSAWSALIHEQFQKADTDDLRIELTLPSGTPCHLVIVRLAVESDDQTACWVLIPGSRTTSESSDSEYETSVWSCLVDGLKPALDEVASGAEELSRDYCRQVKKLDDALLNRLHDAVRTVHQILHEGSLLRFGRSRQPATVWVDLNSLVEDAIENVRGQFPDVEIDCEWDDLPSVHTSRTRLLAVLSNLMANCVRHNLSDKVSLSVNVGIHADRCRIAVTDSNSGMSRHQFKQLFDFYLPPSDSDNSRRNGGPGLALAQLLISDLGGKLTGASKEGVGTRLSVLLPREKVSEER